MDEEGLLTHKSIDTIKAFLTDELRSYGYEVPDTWDDGLDICYFITFTRGTDAYRMVVCRKENSMFDFGIFKFPYMKAICPHEDIQYNDNYQTILRERLTRLK
jgi:hypothetical protein